MAADSSCPTSFYDEGNASAMKTIAQSPTSERPLSASHPQVIVCGLSSTGYKIFCLLRQQGVAVVGIHTSSLPEEEQDVIVGDPQATETLMAAGLEQAQTLVLTSPDDALNLAILVQARLLKPQIRIINRLFNQSLGDRLDQTLPRHYTMSVSALAAPVFTFAALGNRAIGQLNLFEQTWPIHEEFIHDQHPWRGRPLNQLWVDRDRMLISYLPRLHRLDLVSAVIQEKVLDVGDRLIIATRPRIHSARKPIWQRVLKLARNLRRFRAQGQASLGVLFALLLLIAGATLTYVLVSGNTSIVDALYFSVGMITGAGGQEQVAEQASPWVKVLTAAMMLVGAGLIGVCYAVLNDLFLGTRFRQVWDVARIPTHGHYIVCGLGGIGIHIAQQLHHQGHEVVIVERDAQCRFLATARAAKIPVVIGDANLPSVLEATHLKQSAAMLAVTSADMVNLEIALTAKGLAPHIPVVVRNQDPQFSRMSQTVFEFNSVLSPVELVAPSFAAAALGGKILGCGLMANHLWVALRIRIKAEHPFHGQRVRDIAQHTDFVPLYLETANYTTLHGWDLLNASLETSDLLYLAMPASKLDHLWRQPSHACSPQ